MQGLLKSRSMGTGLVVCLAVLLSACSTVPSSGDGAELAVSPWARASTTARAESVWRHQPFPGKRASLYQPQRKDGRDVVMAHAASSASMVRRRVRVQAAELGRLRFSWLVPAVIASADMSRHDREDSPVRLVLAFDGDRSRFPARYTAMSDLAETLTGEPMPYATLMYVWGTEHPPGTVIVNPRTSRIRKLVLESGPANLGRWLSYERDICADFLKAFGEPPGTLLSIAIMTDTDNTRSEAQAWYGPVRHENAGSGCQAPG